MIRQTIEIDSMAHANPIPAASRIGPMLHSSVIPAFNPGTRDLPEGIEAQVENVFHHTGNILQAAQASWDDVLFMAFYVSDLAHRAAINEPWVVRFPNPDSRPARHTEIAAVDGPSLVRATFQAYIDDSD